MIPAILLLYLLVVVLVAAIAFQGSAWYRKYRIQQKKQAVPKGFEPTSEVHIDPTTGVRQRVWYNPSTGERFYVNESDHPG